MRGGSLGGVFPSFGGINVSGGRSQVGRCPGIAMIGDGRGYSRSGLRGRCCLNDTANSCGYLSYKRINFKGS